MFCVSTPGNAVSLVVSAVLTVLTAFGLALAVVQGIEPRDEIEAMLAAQMAIIHSATMRFGRMPACHPLVWIHGAAVEVRVGRADVYK